MKSKDILIIDQTYKVITCMRADQKGQINRDFKIVIIDIRKIPFFILYYTHFEITGGPCNLIGSNWYDLLTNCTLCLL